MNTSPRFNIKGNAFELVSSPTFEADAQQRMSLVEWINAIVPHFYLSVKASDEELRASLLDGDILCQILHKLKYISPDEEDDSSPSPRFRRRKIQRFIAAMSEMGLRSFEMSDLEKGSMKPVLVCLLALKEHSMPHFGSSISKAVDDRRKSFSDSKFQRAFSSLSPESPTKHLHNGNKFHEVFQMKQGFYTDLPATKISELLKSNSLDNAPTQSLLSVINGILDESIERKNAEIPQRVACLLRKVVLEIERRIATQAEHLKTQSNLFKAREEKYQSRIRVLEALAKGTSEETEIVMNQLQHIKSEKSKMDEKKRAEQQEAAMLKKQKDESNVEISALKQELEMAKASMLKKQKDESNVETETLKQELEKANAAILKKQKDESNVEIETLKQQLERANAAILKKQKDESSIEIETLKQQLETANAATLKKQKDESDIEIQTLKEELEMTKAAILKKQKDENNIEIQTLKQELEMAKKTHELRNMELETETNMIRSDLEKRIRQQEQLLEDSKVKMKEIEVDSMTKSQSWIRKVQFYESFMDNQQAALQELRHSSDAIKKEMLKAERTYQEELNRVGKKLKKLAEAAQNYHTVLNENRKIYNELQDLKGNIRVYCRVRPFLPGENRKQTVLDNIGDHGELTVTNPLKPKDSQKSFRFNKVYGPMATQAEVFSDTQPLIRTILDGYNVCIFAYGQTGSGKTYTMSGPDNATKEDWGVNYRALDDLFQISEDRKNFFLYEIGVQMIEIYNEQIRDLLSSDGSQKKLGILTTPQPHGLAVPDASMHPVRSTEDVIELMNIGLTNRSVSATAMNERSSRSHSVVTIHVQGTDLKTGATSHGSLHLVDLAGSERVDRSEATGDRLREAQHINKSLSALGDVIFALAQKSPHVPYRNSKLTQVLQASLGGRAKTLMFVQMNPDVSSYSETLSTLKFAERVSGVELGAARSSKEGRDVRELMDQVASLKDTIAKKDEEIERLQLLKDPKSPQAALKRNTSSLRNGPSSPSGRSVGSSSLQKSPTPSISKQRTVVHQKSASEHYQDNKSDNSDPGSYARDDVEVLRSSRSMNDLKHQKDSPRQSKLAGGSYVEDDEIGMGDADTDERLSEISDGDLSVGTDPDGAFEASFSPESTRQPSVSVEKRREKPKTPTSSRVSQPSRLASQTGASRLSQVKTTMRAASALRKPGSGSSSPVTPSGGRRWG